MITFNQLQEGNLIYANIDGRSYNFKVVSPVKKVTNENFYEIEYFEATQFLTAYRDDRRFKLALSSDDLNNTHTHGLLAVDATMYPCEVYSDATEFYDYVRKKIDGVELPYAVIAPGDTLYTYDDSNNELDRVNVFNIKKETITTDFAILKTKVYDELTIVVNSNKYGKETYKIDINKLSLKDSFIVSKRKSSKKLYINNNFILNFALEDIRLKQEDLESKEKYIQNELFTL